MLLELDGNDATGWKPREPVEFVSGPYRSLAPMFSPDGNWLAYVSDKSGRLELYVRPFSGPGDEVQVSSGGANDPRWSKVDQIDAQHFPYDPECHRPDHGRAVYRARWGVQARSRGIGCRRHFRLRLSGSSVSISISTPMASASYSPMFRRRRTKPNAKR